ncbi:MAG: universal stress protein [Alkalilacustris sp.]
MYSKIIVPVALGGTGVGRALVERARALLDRGGGIVLIHVMEPLPPYLAATLPREQLAGRRRDVLRKLESLGAGAGKVQVDYDIREGNAPTNILEAAREHGADLILIGSHVPGFSDYFIGSTAARVVRHAQCSVLVER